MNLTKFISAAVGAAMLFASLPTNGTVVNFAEDTLKANAEDYDTATTTEPYYSTTEPYSYYYGSEDASEAASWTATEASRPWYEDATEVASSEAPCASETETDARDETTYPYWLEETTDPNGSYDSSLSADSLAVYFFSSDTNFDKLTEAIKSHQNGTSTVTYTYNGKTVESPKDIFKKGQHKYELRFANESTTTYAGRPSWASAGDVTIYIGVKGDANLDDTVNAKDSISTLQTFANAIAGQYKPLQSDDSLEYLANYLADVDAEQLNYSNLDSKDAVWTLQFYADCLTEKNTPWNELCKDLADSGKVYDETFEKPSLSKGDENADTVISIGNVTVNENSDYANIPVTISNNSGFAGGGLVFDYDSKLSFDNVIEEIITPEESVNNNSLALTFASYKNREVDGTMFVLRLKLPKDKKSGDVFNISGSIDMFCDEYGRDLPVKITDGKITVDKDYSENDDPYMTALSIGDVDVVEADTGNTILVPVSISYSPKFSTIGMNIKYDKKIESVSVEGYWNFDSDIFYGDKYISIKYSESEDKYLSGTIFYLRVKLPENAKANDVYNISAEITEFANAAGENIKAKTSDGKITVREILKPTNVTYNHSNDNETVIEVGNVAVSKENAGKIIEVPVSIFNNPGFAASGIRYTFDEKINSLGVEEGLIRETSDSSGPVTSSVNGVIAVTNTSKYDIKSDGVLYYLKLRLPGDAKVGDVYNISGEICQFANADTKDVKAKSYSGSITIVGDSEPLKATVKTNELEVGKKTTIEANQDNLTYSTSDINVAVVSKSGEITAISAGTAIITVINSDGETDQIVMTVKGLSLETTTTVPTTTTTTTSTKSLGDLNGDGKTDSKDAVIVLKSYAEKLAGNPTKDDTSAGDVNGDGEVNSKDAVIILRYYASVIAGVFKGNISEFK